VEDVAIIDMSVNDRSQQMTVKYAVANVPDGGVAPLQALLEVRLRALWLCLWLCRPCVQSVACSRGHAVDVPSVGHVVEIAMILTLSLPLFSLSLVAVCFVCHRRARRRRAR